MDNVGIVVHDLDAAIEFSAGLGLALEGRMPIEREWAGRVTGLRDQRVEIAMLRTPDGHSRVGLSRFDAMGLTRAARRDPSTFAATGNRCRACTHSPNGCEVTTVRVRHDC